MRIHLIVEGTFGAIDVLLTTAVEGATDALLGARVRVTGYATGSTHATSAQAAAARSA
jgi:hypothetical protein